MDVDTVICGIFIVDYGLVTSALSQEMMMSIKAKEELDKMKEKKKLMTMMIIIIIIIIIIIMKLMGGGGSRGGDV